MEDRQSKVPIVISAPITADNRRQVPIATDLMEASGCYRRLCGVCDGGYRQLSAAA
jgi:hypothetical protein